MEMWIIIAFLFTMAVNIAIGVAYSGIVGEIKNANKAIEKKIDLSKKEIFQRFSDIREKIKTMEERNVW